MWRLVGILFNVGAYVLSTSVGESDENMSSKKKTPFQKHREEEEAKKKVNAFWIWLFQ